MVDEMMAGCQNAGSHAGCGVAGDDDEDDDRLALQR